MVYLTFVSKLRDIQLSKHLLDFVLTRGDRLVSYWIGQSCPVRVRCDVPDATGQSSACVRLMDDVWAWLTDLKAQKPINLNYFCDASTGLSDISFSLVHC